MLNITINNKVYNIEYGVEATLCSECIEKVIDLMTNVANGGQDAIKGISNLGDTVVAMLYAGLMKYHGIKRSGDKSVPFIGIAEDLLLDYMESSNKNLYDILTMLSDQMAKDGFFDRVGLADMIQSMITTQKESQVENQDK